MIGQANYYAYQCSSESEANGDSKSILQQNVFCGLEVLHSGCIVPVLLS